MVRLVVLPLVACFLLSCSPSGVEVVVDVKTDLEPGVEFASIRVELIRLTGEAPDLDSVRRRDAEAQAASDYLAGIRVAEYDELESGAFLLTVELADARGTIVAAREVRVALAESLGLTVVVTRDCRGVVCPAAGGSPNLSTCLAGRCVDPACLEGSEAECPDPECEDDSGCVPSVPCAEGTCVAGVCLFEGQPDRCETDEWCSPEGGCMPLPGEMMGDCIPVVEACNGVDDDCDTIADEGFDFDLDVSNCGGCGNTCSLANAMVQCTSGACEVAACNLGFDDCDGQPGTGCETPLDTASNCGACGNACAFENATAGCAAGACVIASCDGGFDDCNVDGGDGCEAALGSPATCGTCGTTCGSSAPLCAPGGGAGFECVTGCPMAAPTLCTMSCVNTDTDVLHCGVCDNACTVANGTPKCNAGSCEILTCDDDFDDCDSDPSNGCEQGLTEEGNCGACGVDCALESATESCATGSCEITTCLVGFGDCDGIPATGCEQALVVFYRDMDMDGLGDPTMPSAPLCDAPVGFVENDTDCDDTDGEGIPGMAETCNGADDDCDGLIDEGRYDVLNVLNVSHGEHDTADAFGPDIAYNGTEIGVAWTATGRDGSDGEVWFARAPPDLSAAISSHRLTDTPNVISSQSARIEWDGGRWMVGQTEVDSSTPSGRYAFLDPADYSAAFTTLSSGTNIQWIERGEPGTDTMYLGAGSIGSFDVRMYSLSRSGALLPGPFVLVSGFHSGSGIYYLGSGLLGVAYHSGITGNQPLTYHRKSATTGMTDASIGGLTPAGSANGGRTYIAREGGRLAIVTQTDWAGGARRGVVTLIDQDAGSPTGSSLPASRTVGVGAAPENASFGFTADGELKLRTFTGRFLDTITMPLSTSHSGIGGDIGPHAYVIAYADGASGVRLVGVGCR